VRKVSGFRKPSKANQAAFDGAVRSIADHVRLLLNELPQPPAREIEVADSVGAEAQPAAS
jgi:hypothetical protein